MNMDSRFERLSDKIKTLQREMDRATGALEVSEKKLKMEFGLTSLNEAKKELISLKRELDKAEKDFETALSEFEKEWEKDE